MDALLTPARCSFFGARLMGISECHSYLCGGGQRHPGQRLADGTTDGLYGTTTVPFRLGTSPTGIRLTSFRVPISITETELLPEFAI